MQCVKLVGDCQTKELSNSLIIQANPCCLPVCTSQCHKRRILLPFTLIVKELRKSAAEGLTSACGVPMSFSSESVREKTEPPKNYTKKRRRRQSKWQNIPRHLPTIVSASQTFFSVGSSGSFLSFPTKECVQTQQKFVPLSLTSFRSGRSSDSEQFI